MRRMLMKEYGFTLVELMVVVVVLGILAGIAVQRMGDVRERAERAADEANARLLLGAANLAFARNYADADLTTHGGRVIRWQRPCQQPAVVQAINQISGWMMTGWTNIQGHGQHTGGEWDFHDYFESFPVGYAVEIITTPIPPEPGDTHDHILGGLSDVTPQVQTHGNGYSWRYAFDVTDDSGHVHEEGLLAYKTHNIRIFRYTGSPYNQNDPYWSDWDPNEPNGGAHGNYATDYGNLYPYSNPGKQRLDYRHWNQVFP